MARADFMEDRGDAGPAVFESAVSDSGIEVHGVRVPPSVARAAWEFLRARHGRSGWYPFLTVFGPVELVAHDRGGQPWGGGSRQLLDAALAADPEDVVSGLVHSVFREMAEIYIPPRSDDDLREIEEIRLLFDADHTALSLCAEFSEPLPGIPRRAESMGRNMWLNLVRARGGYGIPALFPRLLQTPNWSGYPDDRELLPADHVAVLGHWHKTHGADFYYADSAALDLLVKNPPRDRRAAAKAAVEQYVYCPDSIPDPESAGNGQVGSSVWSFWWD
ncbi:DUF4253 domain-containing protein [Streptomyces sannanensis]